VVSAVGTRLRRMLRVLDVSAEFATTIFRVNDNFSGIMYPVYLPRFGMCRRLSRDWMSGNANRWETALWLVKRGDEKCS
jgi:hypothetical protein